ncbi:MAG: hypothetical protein O2964_05175 [Verrucomicrobia bacterium]|jgi:hypothetical protein|nr:hypothetical protein [Verrucomicrobiota bacterium]
MTTNSPALIVPDTSSASTNSIPSELHDIRPAMEIVSVWEYVGWVVGALVLVLVAYFLARYLLKKRRETQAIEATRPAVPAHVLARQRLDASLDQLHDPRAFCILVSDAIRYYLEDRFELKAPERTTEEFLEELQSSYSLNFEHKQTLEAFLQQCDMAKFAKADMLGQELKSLYDIGVQFVRETEPEAVSAPGAKVSAPSETDTDHSERGGA